MRSFLVENLDEFIKARLLLQEIGRRWFGGFFFKVSKRATNLQACGPFFPFRVRARGPEK